MILKENSELQYINWGSIARKIAYVSANDCKRANAIERSSDLPGRLLALKKRDEFLR